MKSRNFVRIAVAGVAALALVAAAVGLAARRSGVASARSVQPFVHAKGNPRGIAAGDAAPRQAAPDFPDVPAKRANQRHPDRP